MKFKQIFLCLISIMMLFSLQSWAQGHVVQKTTFGRGFNNSTGQTLSEGEMLRFGSNAQCVATGNSAFRMSGNYAYLYLAKDVTVNVTSNGNGTPGIEVPQGKTLYIIGETGSKLVVTGGGAGQGGNGLDGKKSTSNMLHNGFSSIGGKGGDGGTGGAPAIGGRGGAGGTGGAGGAAVQASDQDKNIEHKHGRNGSNGSNGSVGQTMGNVYIMGSIIVECHKGGECKTNASGGNCSEVFGYPSGLSVAYYGSAGGGAAGGNGGVSKYDIGSGGPGGGAGGGGASGCISKGMNFGPNEVQYYHGKGGLGGQEYELGSFIKRFAANGSQKGNTNLDAQGGNAGSVGGDPSSQGQLFVSDAASIIGSYASKTTIDNTNYSLNTYIKFDASGVETSAFPENQMYIFYGTLPATVTKPVATDGRVFGGFYYINKENQSEKVYDENGNLLADFTDFKIESIEGFKLYAVWTGQTTVKRICIVKNLDTGVYEYYSSDEQAVVIESGSSKTVSVNAPTLSGITNIHCTNSTVDNVVVNANQTTQVIFKYDYDTKEMTFYYEDYDSDSEYITLYNGNGQAVTNFTRATPIGQSINVHTEFTNPEHAAGMTVAWSYTGDKMPDHDVDNELSLSRKYYKVYEEASPYGHFSDLSLLQEYLNVCQWLVETNPGCRINGAKAYRYDATTQQKGAFVDDLVLDEVDSVFCLNEMPASDIILVLEGQQLWYEVDDTSITNADGGEEVSDVTCTYTDAEGKSIYNEDWYTNVYHAGDVVYIRPVGTDQSHLPYSLDVKVLKQNADQEWVVPVATSLSYYKDASGKYCKQWGFRAPANDVKVKISVKYGDPMKLYVKNHDEGNIKKVYVNGTQVLEGLGSGAEETSRVRPNDIVSAQATEGEYASCFKATCKIGGAQTNIDVETCTINQEETNYTYSYFVVPENATEVTLELTTEGVKTISEFFISDEVIWSAPKAAMPGDKVNYTVTPVSDRVRVDWFQLYNAETSQLFLEPNALSGSFTMPDFDLSVEVQASFDDNQYTITFKNPDGTLLATQNKYRGEEVSYSGETPEMASGVNYLTLEFDHWYPELAPAAGSQTYYAVYKPIYKIADEINGEEVDNSELLQTLNGATTNVEIHRSMQAGNWYTLILPVSLTAEQVTDAFGEFSVYQLLGVGNYDPETEGGKRKLCLEFDSQKIIGAGIPYLVNPKKNFTSRRYENKAVSNKINNSVFTYVEFCGIYDRKEMTQGDDTHLFFVNDALYYPRSTADMKSLRGYIHLRNGFTRQNYYVYAVANQGEPDASEMHYFFVDGEDEMATAIANVSSTESDGGVRKFLHNNTIYINVNGVIYDLRGNRVPDSLIK